MVLQGTAMVTLYNVELADPNQKQLLIHWPGAKPCLHEAS